MNQQPESTFEYVIQTTKSPETNDNNNLVVLSTIEQITQQVLQQNQSSNDPLIQQVSLPPTQTNEQTIVNIFNTSDEINQKKSFPESISNDDVNFEVKFVVDDQVDHEHQNVFSSLNPVIAIHQDINSNKNVDDNLIKINNENGDDNQIKKISIKKEIKKKNKKILRKKKKFKPDLNNLTNTTNGIQKKKKFDVESNDLDDSMEINESFSESTFREHIRHVMLFYFRRGKKIISTTRKIREVYGPKSISDRTVSKWFRRFKEGQTSLEDNERCGRPVCADDERIKALLYENPRYSIRELAQTLGLAKSTVQDHLSKLGYINRNETWIPKCIDNQNERKQICQKLLERYNLDNSFLDRVVFGGERWISLDNSNPTGNGSIKRKINHTKYEDSDDEFEENHSEKQIIKNECQKDILLHDETTNNNNNNCKKVLLSIWWDCNGVIYYELMDQRENKCLTPERYCQQLDRVHKYMQQVRPGLALLNQNVDQTNLTTTTSNVIYHHDKAKPHISSQAKHRLLQLRWEEMEHPAYSPDLAPCDYHLFMYIQTHLQGKTFQNMAQLQQDLNAFFNHQNKTFWHDAIRQLPKRWKKVLEKDGRFVKP